MNLVFDVLHCDVLEFSVPRSPLSMGQGYASLDEGFRALLASFDIELMEYDTATRSLVGDRVHIRIMGKRWLDQRSR